MTNNNTTTNSVETGSKLVDDMPDEIRAWKDKLGCTLWSDDMYILKTKYTKTSTVNKQIKDLNLAKLEAESLAMALWNQHYKKDSPNFELCDSVAGVITQINNMTAGLTSTLQSQINKAVREALDEASTKLETCTYSFEGRKTMRTIINSIKERYKDGES